MGNLQRHADRTSWARRRLLHHPCGCLITLCPDDSKSPHRYRVSWRFDHGTVVFGPSSRKLPLYTLWWNLRNHEGLWCVIQPRWWSTSGLYSRCQWWSTVLWITHFRWVDSSCLETWCASDDWRSGACAYAYDQRKYGSTTWSLPRSALLHVRTIDHRYCTRLWPYYFCDWCGDDWLVWDCHAVLCHP